MNPPPAPGEECPRGGPGHMRGTAHTPPGHRLPHHRTGRRRCRRRRHRRTADLPAPTDAPGRRGPRSARVPDHRRRPRLLRPAGLRPPSPRGIRRPLAPEPVVTGAGPGPEERATLDEPMGLAPAHGPGRSARPPTARTALAPRRLRRVPPRTTEVTGTSPGSPRRLASRPREHVRPRAPRRSVNRGGKVPASPRPRVPLHGAEKAAHFAHRLVAGWTHGSCACSRATSTAHRACCCSTR